MTGKFTSWEQAVQWLTSQPEYEQIAQSAYLDLPTTNAAKRFSQSLEWQEMLKLLPKVQNGFALDVGAGNGIASYALASAGWQVTALEPDQSYVVGANAIKKLAQQLKFDVKIIQNFGEDTQLTTDFFDLIYARQVMHHSTNLNEFCAEMYRIVKPGGMLVTVRDHVISKNADLESFLNKHQLHHMYGGENAFLLSDYKNAIKNAGFKLHKTLLSLDSPINYAPFTLEDLKEEFQKRSNVIPGVNLISSLFISDAIFPYLLRLLSHLDQRPGRLVSFIAYKTKHA